MKPFVRVLIVGALLGAAGAPRAEGKRVPNEKEVAIRKLLVLSGSAKMGMQVMTQMTHSFQTAIPNVPAKFWDDFAARVKPDDLTEMIVPIYAAHFSLDDVKGLIAFYESAVGKKLVAEQPMIVQESMVKGQAWGQKIGKELVEKLKAEGYMPSSAGKPAPAATPAHP